MTARVKETAQRVYESREDLLRAIQAAPVAGKSTLRALERWWYAYNEQSWEDRFSAERSSLDTLLKDRRDLEHSCRNLSDTVSGQLSNDIVFALESLLAASNSEHRARRDLYVHRGDGDNPHVGKQERLTREFNDLEKDRQDSFKRLVVLQASVERLRNERNEARGSYVEKRSSTQEDSFIKTLRRVVIGYSQLWEQLPDLDSHVDQDAWCSVLVHGGFSRLMLQQEGGLEYLRTAASAWEGACRGVVAPYLAVPLFQATWAEALFMESARKQVRLHIAFDDGKWSMDGVRLYGAGNTEVTVHPGTHRFECIPDRLDTILYEVEDLLPGEHVALQVVGDFIDIFSLPQGTDTRVYNGDSFTTHVAPSAAQLSAYGVELEETDIDSIRPATVRLHLSGTWLQHDSLPHVGLSIGASRVVFRSERLEVDVGFTQDMATGQHPYSYSLDDDTEWTSRTFFRDRVGVRLRSTILDSRPTIEGFSGVVPPFNAAIAEFAIGWEWFLDHGVGVAVRAGTTSTFWKDTAPLWFEPSFSLGLTRWYQESS